MEKMQYLSIKQACLKEIPRSTDSMMMMMVIFFMIIFQK